MSAHNAGPTGDGVGGLFGSFTTAVTQAIPNPSAILFGSVARLIIYALVVLIVAGVVLVTVDAFFPFLPMNPIGPSIVARSVKTFWQTGGENLMIPAANSPTVTPGNWTMSIQTQINSVNPSNQYKHIVHRGSNPMGIKQPGGGTGTTGYAGFQVSDIPTTSADALAYGDLGLPAIMNPGIFLDRQKNDIHVFIHTQDGSGSGGGGLLLESMTISDVPVGAPITVGAVCNGQMLEVYLNCRLYNTLLLKGRPMMPPADNQWFGRYGAFPLIGSVQNLQLWDASIGSTDYMSMCKAP